MISPNHFDSQTNVKMKLSSWSSHLYITRISTTLHQQESSEVSD